MPFTALGLSPNLVRALQLGGFTHPTPIQCDAIPPILAGRDVVASAQTGSGKTLAYGLALLQKISGNPPHRIRAMCALVLVPTRELAVQVGNTLRELAGHLEQKIRVSVAFGGVSINPQLLALRGGTHILVATPGRLLDLVAHNAIHLETLQTLVLDEADRLLDLGFLAELQAILELLPITRQSLFFSATFPPLVVKLADELMSDPLRIAIAPQPDSAPDIAQHAVLVEAGRRTQLLRHLINTHHWKRVLVFVATKHAAEVVADKLRKVRIHAEPFHGELSQGKRLQVLSDFKASRLAVIVATDMASRGIDIHQLPVVVNYDLPRSSTDYIHRIGRTGRAGQPGVAFSFVTPDNQQHFSLIQKKNAISIALDTIEGFEATSPPAPPLNSSGGVKGKRPSKKDKLRARALAT